MGSFDKIRFEDIKVGTKEWLDFRVTEKSDHIFAVLTGDNSSLHTDESFSRKTKYRDRIVHGMLPFSYISLLKIFKVEKHIAFITKLSAKFINPIYLESNLTMTAEVMNKEPSAKFLDIEIVIQLRDSGKVATTGSVGVKFEEREDEHIFSQELSGELCLLTKPVVESKLIFGEIKEGMTNSLNFLISLGHILKFEYLLGEEDKRKEFSLSLLNIRVLSSSLFSTFIGMCIPGQSAAFLGFEIDFLKRIPLEKNLILRGEVVKKSEATRSIKLDFLILDENNINYAVGKATAMVNLPLAKMPSISEIKQEKIDFGLKDKVVLITGASRGIGETTAKLFALLGAKVVVNYCKSEEDAKKVVGEILEEKGEAIALKADVSDLNEVKEMVHLVYERYGKIDVLVNNAVRDFLPKKFLDLEWEDIQKDIDITIKGAFNCCKTIIPFMIRENGGSIINISSLATDNPPPNQLKYVVSKSGLIGLTRSLAIEYASENIRANLVVPNFVETDLVAHVPNIFRRKIASEIPLRRNASPIEVAKSVVFLASSFSSYITGQRIMVTGGSLPFL